MDVTNDLSKFGYREYDMAGDLLKAYAQNPLDELGDGVQVWFNANSGNVFLCDEDFNTAMMNDGKLAIFYTCQYCGKEGFAEEIEDGDGHSFDDQGDINCPKEED